MSAPRDRSTFERLQQLVSERILVFEGPKGTAIQAAGLEEADFRGERFADHPRDLKGNTDAVSLIRPQVVLDIHRAYLEAGADIVTTNTFTASSISQADYALGDLSYEMNRASAEIARRAAAEWTSPEKPRFAAGSLGPLNKTLSLSPDVNDPSYRAISFDQARASYAEQVRGLVDGGSEILLLETIFDTLNAKAAIVAIEEVFEERGVRLPLCISGTIVDRSGRTLSGQTLDAFWISVEHARPFSVGLNCSLGATEMTPHLEELARISPIPVSCYPNAGLPNAFGGYDETARNDGAPDPRVRGERVGEPRRGLLRNDTGSHPGDRRGGGRTCPPASSPKSPSASAATQWPRAARGPPRHELRHDRGAHERDRLAPLPEADPGGGPPVGARSGTRAGARRRQPDRREHG